MGTQGYTDPGGRCSVYDPVLSTNYTTGVWRTCPLWESLFDPFIGQWISEEFITFNKAATDGDYVGTAATSGSAAIATTAPQGLLLDSGATTATQGYQVQRLKCAIIPAANKSIWAEFKISLTAATPPVTKWVGFVGLAASDTTIFASGAQTTNNRIGWQTQTTENLAATFTADKAGTATTKTGPTLADGVAIRLGFFYDGAADTLQQYVNGATLGTPVATANIAKLVMYPSFACLSDGTDQPKLTVLGYQIFQLR